MFAFTYPEKENYVEKRRLPMSAMVQPYSRSAVAKRRKGRGMMGKKGLSIKASGGKQPLGAKPLMTTPLRGNSHGENKWFLPKGETYVRKGMTPGY